MVSPGPGWEFKAPEDPPPLLLDAQKHVGGVIFRVVR